MLAETMCAAASAAGLGIAAVTAYRRRFLAATRIVAYSLVPIGLVLTGVVKWVAGIAFDPGVWLGFAALGVAWLLLMTTRAIERRGGGTRKERRAAARKADAAAVAPPAAAPPLGAGTASRGAGSTPKAKPERGAAGSDEDFSDIEAILKKHGL